MVRFFKNEVASPVWISGALENVKNFKINTVFVSLLTEASKIVMRYVAAVSGKGQEVDRVKEQLLQSNPVLEGMSFS